jgi:hypothetical protein
MTRMNEHFKRQYDSANCALLPADVKDAVRADFEVMSHIGIDNDDDQNKFFLVRNHVPEVIHLIFNSKLNDKTARAVAAEVFRNREKNPIGTLLELIEATDLALKKMVPPELRPKLAYPQPGPRNQLPQYDVGRWVDATRHIYSLMAKGHSQAQAKQSVIGKWEHREQMDYEYWLKFYRERVPEKYPKLAQDNNLGGLGGIPVDILQANIRGSKRFPAPFPGGLDPQAHKVPPGLPQRTDGDSDPVRDTIEGQRRKLISRLNAAEKLLYSSEGQLFAGEDQELMLKLLQDLKRRIQIANKRTVRSSLFEDHIFRAANLLKIQGRDKPAAFFYKIAQLPPPPPPGGGLSGPPGGDLFGDLGGGGAPPDGDSGGGGDSKQETHDLLKEFFDALKRGVSDKDDTPEEREKAEEESAPSAPPPAEPAAPPSEGATATALFEVDEQIKLGMGYWTPELRAFAQVAPVPPGPPAAPAPAVPVEDVVVDPKEDVPEQATDNTDDVIEAALKNVNINDVISRLEMLVSVYNRREISRQLAILDIMMDRLGLASFFPALGEAMSKALEANQYIGNRLQEILGKVKSSVEAPGTDEWVEIAPENQPQETESVRQRLQQNIDKEEARKEMRKEREVARMEGGEPGPAPQVARPVGEEAELQRPSRVEKAPPIRTR